jgi:hypothetical protein
LDSAKPLGVSFFGESKEVSQESHVSLGENGESKDTNEGEGEGDSRAARVNQLLAQMHTSSDSSGLADFAPRTDVFGPSQHVQPFPPPYAASRDNARASIYAPAAPTGRAQLGLGNQAAGYAQSYGAHPQMYRGAADRGGASGESRLLEKINYMIHMMEEQQHERTANVAEEFVLYLFLGVFVIFVVDSFSRAGKYTR